MQISIVSYPSLLARKHQGARQAPLSQQEVAILSLPGQDELHPAKAGTTNSLTVP
jgi:hypothetical protein